MLWGLRKEEDGQQLVPNRHYDEGWRDYDYRMLLRSRPARLIPFREWEGGPLDGRTLFVSAEQGLGDELMFASCVPELLARGARLHLECEHRLAALFAQFVRGKSPDEVEANVLRWRELLLAVCGAPFDPEEAQVYASYILETTQLSAERCERLFLEILGRDGDQPMKTTADKLREEGKEVGLSQGLNLGRAEGQARVLLTLLCRRFGALTKAHQERVTTATSDQLEAIALRILDAKTIEEALLG